VVRRTIELWNATEIDQALDGLADDVEMDWSNSIGPLKGIYRGREGLLKLWRSFLDAWVPFTGTPKRSSRRTTHGWLL
jgi:hypothetical protein